jgi:hypothetical protein
MSSPPKEPAKKKQRQRDKKKSKDTDTTVLFEFKFCSVYMGGAFSFKDYDLSGILNVPLLRDTESGRLRLPPGDSIVEGYLTRQQDKQASNGNDSEAYKEKFTARIKEVIRNDSKIHHIYLGYTYEKGTLKKISSTRGVNDTHSSLEYTTCDASKPYDYNALGHWTLGNWAQKAGGILLLECRHYNKKSSGDKLSDDENSEDELLAEYTALQLYTVLSENIPGRVISKLAPGASPNWDRLEKLVDGYGGEWGTEWGTGNFASVAVAEYKRFIALKICNDDWDSKKFAPSPEVDKIWHRHLAFTEHYQHDIMAFSVQICGKGHLVQHCPFLSEDFLVRYHATLDGIASEDLAKIVGSPVNMRFWPNLKLTPIVRDSRKKFTGCC